MKTFLKNSSPFVMVLVAILIYLLPFIGYCMCIYKFIKCDFSKETSYKPEIIYGIGVASGLGCFIGWFDLGK